MSTTPFTPACPLPIQQYPHVLMAHGGGGRLMHQLLEEIFGRAFANPILDARHDSARVDWQAGNVAMTTDSYVIRPLFFPGGDIGSMAVHGTVNDLAVSGAQPRWLTLSLIIEEGLTLQTFDRVIQSIANAAKRSMTSSQGSASRSMARTWGKLSRCRAAV